MHVSVYYLFQVSKSTSDRVDVYKNEERDSDLFHLAGRHEIRADEEDHGAKQEYRTRGMKTFDGRQHPILCPHPVQFDPPELSVKRRHGATQSDSTLGTPRGVPYAPGS